MFRIGPKTKEEQEMDDACEGRMRTLGADSVIAMIAATSDAGESSREHDAFIDAIVAGVGASPSGIPDEDDLRRQDVAINRAKIVQKEILRLRDSLRNGHHEGCLLASYDAELSRLCQVPGVMAALLDDTKV